MSSKKKRFAKGLGASALAVATLASGLSFGATSASASAPTAALAETKASYDKDDLVPSTWGKFFTHIENARYPFWSPRPGAGNVFILGHSTEAEARNVSAEWALPDEGKWQQFRWRPSPGSYSECLRFGDFNAEYHRASFGPCGGGIDQLFTIEDGKIVPYLAPHSFIQEPSLHSQAEIAFVPKSPEGHKPLTGEWNGAPIGDFTKLEGAAEFVASIDSRAVVRGTTEANGRVEVRRGSTTIGTETADANGDYAIEIPAPDKAGDDELTVALVEDNTDKKTISVTAAYGAGVAITDPSDEANLSGQYQIRGTAQSGASVSVRINNGTEHPVQVNANGQWSADVVLPMGETTITATQKSKGANTTTSAVTVNPGEASVPAPSADVVFGANVADRARVEGAARDGATVTVRAGAADGPVVGNPQVVNGQFSVPVNSPGAGEHSFFVTQTIDNETSAPTEATGDFGAAVAVNALPAQILPGDRTISGAGENGTSVTVQVGSESKAAPVVNGAWSATFELRPSNTPVSVNVSQTARGNTVTTASTSTTANLPIAAREVTIDEPSSHQYTPMVDTTLSGTATPYASVKIETTRGGLIREVRADKDGNWAFNRMYGPSNVYMLVATQTRVDGTTSESSEFVMSPVGAFRPLSVTSHTDGGTYTPGANTFRGTATPGSMISVTNQWGRQIASVQASAVSGAWEATGNLGPTADYTLTFTQTAPNGQKDEVTMDLSSDMPAYEDAVLTSPSNNSTYRPGAVRFTGTGSEGTEIVAKNQWNTMIGKATVGSDGTWMFDRNLGPTADYQITFTATRGADSNSFQVNLNSPKAAPLVITSHATGDTYTPGQQVTFRGTASPFADIDVKTKRGGQVATATADENGEWSFTRAFGPTNVYEMVFTQTDVYGDPQAGAEFNYGPNPAR